MPSLHYPPRLISSNRCGPFGYMAKNIDATTVPVGGCVIFAHEGTNVTHTQVCVKMTTSAVTLTQQRVAGIAYPSIVPPGTIGKFVYFVKTNTILVTGLVYPGDWLRLSTKLKGYAEAITSTGYAKGFAISLAYHSSIDPASPIKGLVVPWRV